VTVVVVTVISATSVVSVSIAIFVSRFV